jgi:hypothetical protein
MRLKQRQREEAKREILWILSFGECRTSELSGTPRFHGHNTLSAKQVLSLLHELEREGKVQMSYHGHWKFGGYLAWRLT